MKRFQLPSRHVILVLAATAVTLAVAACGSSSNTKSSPTSANASGAAGATANVAACLRKHGVTLPAGGRWSATSRRPTSWRRIRRTAERLRQRARRLPRWRERIEVPGGAESVRREGPGAPEWCEAVPRGNPEVRRLRAPAWIQAGEPELQRQRSSVSSRHPLEHEVPKGERAMPEPARCGQRRWRTRGRVRIAANLGVPWRHARDSR